MMEVSTLETGMVSLGKYTFPNTWAFEVKVLAFFVTDIIKEGSYIIYSNESKEILEQSFNLIDIKEGMYLDKIVSRKKQIIPNIMEYIEKK